MSTPASIPAGTVVHFVGRARRYVVATVDRGTSSALLLLVALSGGAASSVPSNIKPGEVEIDGDQTVAFGGPRAAHNRARYNYEAMAGARRASCLSAGPIAA